jgi:predicted HTH domain antitoxin
MGLTIPSEIVESLGKDEIELKIELAIFFYKKFNLSSGEAAKFAGIPRVAFWHELGKRKIPINYDEEDARQDIETIQRFNEKFPMKKA